MNTPVYLRPSIVVEPLIDQWYAWPHLISPATVAMNIVERHLKIMESYVRAPQVHAAAVKIRRLCGPARRRDSRAHRANQARAGADDFPARRYQTTGRASSQ